MRDELREARLLEGLTQAQVADQAEISRSYYTLIELDRRDPSISVGIRIGRVVKRPVESLFPLRSRVRAEVSAS